MLIGRISLRGGDSMLLCSSDTWQEHVTGELYDSMMFKVLLMQMQYTLNQKPCPAIPHNAGL